MDRMEGTGIGVALVAHALLFGALSTGFLSTPRPEQLESRPIEISLAGEVAPESTSPMPNADVPAARLSEVEAPLEPEEPPPTPVTEPEPEPAPQPRPQPPRPAPAPAERPVEKAQPTRPTPPQPRAQPRPQPERPRRPTGRLDGIVGGVSEERTSNTNTTPPAANIGPAVRSALVAEIRRQLKPHWDAPTGADADRLVTTVRIRLNRDGSLSVRPVLEEQTGVTASNRGLTDLHLERAIRAVQLAAPFRLPAQYHDAWKDFDVDFDRRLSQ